MPDDGRRVDDLAPQSIKTLADLDSAITRDTTLPEDVRATWLGCLNRIARWLGRPLEDLPASLPGLRFGFERIPIAALGICRKTVQNHQSALKNMLRHTGVLDLRPQARPLSATWTELYDRLVDKRMRLGLSQFVRFASDAGIDPQNVDDAVISAFVIYLEKATFRQKPRELHKQVCKLWNRAVDEVAGWPSIRFAVPDFRPAPTSLPVSAFPASFARDVEDYLFWSSEANQAAEDAPFQPCGQRTLATWRRCILLAASAAVANGHPIESITRLRDLVSPQTARRILEQYLGKEGNKVTTFIANLAQMLASIGRRWAKLPAPEQLVLDKLYRKFEKQRPKGMTDKNVRAVREITDASNYSRLMALPAQLIEEARQRDPGSPRAAVKAQLGIAMLLLLLAPMRSINLATLDLKRHFMRIGGPERGWVIHIADSEVKNSVALDYSLPPMASELIDIYLREFRLRLAGVGNDWLFPGEGGEPKLPTTLSQQITDLIVKRVGIRVTAHQFRHAAAAVILAAHPGNFELVRRVLGHKSLTTTTKFYVGLESAELVRLYQKLVLDAGRPAERQ